MFLTCAIEDNVRVLPKDLGSATLDAVTAVLEKMYIDRVIKDVGLVVTIYDIQSVEGGFVYHSDGAAHFTVRFTLVVFRPLIGGVLTGKVKTCTRKGVWVSLGFFEDVFVPSYSLQQPAEFSEADKAWRWAIEDGELITGAGDPVRLRVVDVKFSNVPTPAQLKQQGEELLGTAVQPFVPMEVIGAMDSDGLGCIAWWAPEADDMEE